MVTWLYMSNLEPSSWEIQLDDEECEDDIYKVVRNANDSNEDVWVFDIQLSSIKYLQVPPGGWGLVLV